MKKLIVAKNIGFCEGVKRSIDIVYSALEQNKGEVFIDGPIVHNSKVVDDLSKLGVSQFDESKKIKKDDTLVIRAHGVTKERKRFLANLTNNLIDATCPKVLRIVGLVKKYINQGYFIVLIGDPNHPEVVGICSHADRNKIIVISDEKGCENLKTLKIIGPILVLAQTTCNTDLFSKLSELIKSKFLNVDIVNTVCDVTQTRQKEVRNLIKLGCDSVLVLGSKFSKNSNELAKIAVENGCRADISDGLSTLDTCFVKNSNVLGLISGASTDIREVLKVKKYLLSLISE